MRLLDQRSSVEKALRIYRTKLRAGAYFFIGNVEHGELRSIEEVAVRQELPGSVGDSDGVVFGFFERGRSSGPGEEDQSISHPLVHHIQATSPEFMRKLQEYLAERIGTL